MWSGATMKLIEARDREFHQHIVKNRVDPTAQSATNPVPDFYGAHSSMLLDMLSLTASTQGRRSGLCMTTDRYVD